MTLSQFKTYIIAAALLAIIIGLAVFLALYPPPVRAADAIPAGGMSMTTAKTGHSINTAAEAARVDVIEQEADYNQFASIVITNQPCLFGFGEGFKYAARMERFDGAKLLGCYKPQQGDPRVALANQKTPWICEHPEHDAIVVQWEPTRVQKGEKYSCFVADRFLDKAKTHARPKGDSI